MEHKKKRCKNCLQMGQGNYCSNCGQKLNLHRLDLKEMIHGISHGVIHFDTGFLFTAKELITRPGQTIREYIHGKRLKHGNPLFMMLILGGLLSYIYSHFYIRTMGSMDLSQLEESAHFLTSKFFAITYFGYCILFAFIDSILFKYKKYNFIEMFYLNVFIGIQVMLVNLVMALFFYIFKGSGINIYIRLILYLLIIFYTFFVKYQFFNLSHDKKGLKLLLAGMIFFMLLMFGVGHKTFEEFFSKFN